MTLSGSRAMVNRNRAMAGPKAMKVQPKNTDAVMLALRGTTATSSATSSALSCFPNGTFNATNA
ncbi:hypothetical protein INR49_020133 [Caranx melampygus]|nr:hypothetical protein INR49_020133 [Caranx melampygus]